MDRRLGGRQTQKKSFKEKMSPRTMIKKMMFEEDKQISISGVEKNLS